MRALLCGDSNIQLLMHPDEILDLAKEDIETDLLYAKSSKPTGKKVRVRVFPNPDDSSYIGDDTGAYDGFAGYDIALSMNEYKVLSERLASDGTAKLSYKGDADEIIVRII